MPLVKFCEGLEIRTFVRRTRKDRGVGSTGKTRPAMRPNNYASFEFMRGLGFK